jgi:putative membrane protein
MHIAKKEVIIMGGMFGGCCGFGSFGGLGMILNLVITVGLIIGLALLLIWLVRRFSAKGEGLGPIRSLANNDSSPSEILKARYAKGEITREQYQQMSSDLG